MAPRFSGSSGGTSRPREDAYRTTRSSASISARRRSSIGRGPVKGDCPGLLALRAPGPGEVGFRRREDRAEDSDDAANLAGWTAVVGQEDADHCGDNGTVHQVLASHRGCDPKGSAEDDVDNQKRHNIGDLVRRNP